MAVGEITAAVIAVLTLMGTWWKMFNSSKSSTAAIEELKKLYSGETNKQIEAEKDIVRLGEGHKQVKHDIEQLKADLIREAQIMANQLSAVHQKIDHIDEKLDKLRDLRYTK